MTNKKESDIIVVLFFSITLLLNIQEATSTKNVKRGKGSQNSFLQNRCKLETQTSLQSFFFKGFSVQSSSHLKQTVG